MIRIATAAVTIAAAVGNVAAQAVFRVSKSSGPFARSRHGLSVDGSTCSLDRAEILAKRNGTTALLPERWPGRGPDYRIASIVGSTLAAQIDVDALSVGEDDIHADVNGVMQPPFFPGWAALTFSVTRGTRGSFGPVRAEATAADGAAGDLFSFHVRRRFIGAGIVDRRYLAQDSPDLLTNCGGMIGDIDAHDLHMAASISAAAIAGLRPQTGVVYFSITSATVGAPPASWWGADGASGATILQSTWDGSAWSAVTPLYTWRDLGLAPGDDIDALAASAQSPRRNYANWILFSTTTGLPDPVMIYCPQPAVGPLPYRVQNGASTVTVSSRMGLGPGGTDDVDAICALDPGGSGLDWHRLEVGSPVDDVVPWPFIATETASTAAAREQFGMRLWMQGCPPGGCGGPSIAVLMLHAAASPAPALTLPFARPPGTDAAELAVPLDETILWGAALDVRWLLVDGGLGAFDASIPVRTTL